MGFDLKIVGGTIVDGSGKPGFCSDIGIRDGRVVALGAVEGEARETIDASGRVVCPGFVDIHTHYDAQIVWDPMLSISPWHGVTTVVMGNCGFGVAPTKPAHRTMIMRTLEKVEGMSLGALQAGLGADWPFESFPQYLDAIEQRGMALNVGVLAGHTPIRTYVMGEDAVKRAASADETAAMAGIVREAMDAGALGFATSGAATHNGYDGHPVPSRLAEFAEVDALVGAMKASGRGTLQATVGRKMFHAEFERFARAHGVPVTWTALLAGMAGPGSHRKHIEQTHRYFEKDGLNIIPQVACRPINFDFDFNEPFIFEMRPVFKETMTADRARKRAIYADAAWRTAFKDDMKPGAPTPLSGWAERAVISVAPGHMAWEERPLAEVAAEEGKAPIDLALDLSLESDFAARFRFGVLNTDESEVAELLTDPYTVVALSDAGAHASQLCDACYATHFLGYWVRERKLFGLEQAIHMLTERAAKVFGISDRGRLAVGLPADVVVFDPATIAAGKIQRVWDLPSGADRLIAPARGIDAVLVNGAVVNRNGREVTAAALPGRLLRGGHA
jgi:N-acyl-D-aspartate/D-glutamate deacylase